MIGRTVNKGLSTLDLKIVRISTNGNPDIYKDNEFKELYSFCSSYTVTSVERMYALYNAIKYLVENNINGDFVECGVWRGGSAMLVAKYLEIKKVDNRKIYLYDTFEGMSKPNEKDIDVKGNKAMSSFSKLSTGEDSSNWCDVNIEEVEKNMYSTGFAKDNIFLVKGKVEDTIPATIPENKISLLRLDTDWYESTKHELLHLYPMLIKNGVLIIDDFGHWEGAKKAVIEYFKETNQTILLNRIDYTGRMGIKT